jgi:AAA family ATP:ADP antiporter
MGFIRSILDIRKGELGKTVGMFAFFFIIIAAYWFLKPLRSALTLEKLGADSIRQLKVITALVSVGVVAAYSIALTRLSRERLTYLVLGTFVWLLLFFWVFFTWFGVVKVVYYCFYVFLDLFVTVNVALFWTFLADITKAESATRLYGIIGAGGVIGGFIGSFSCNSLVDRVSPADMILYVAFIYALNFVIVHLVARRVRTLDQVPRGTIAASGKSRVADALAGARVVFSSKYFMGICFVMAAYELTSAVNDFTFHKAVELIFAEKGGTDSVLGLFLGWVDSTTGIQVTTWLEETFGLQVAGATLGAFFSGFFLAMNLLALVVQVLLTSLVIRRAGMTTALLILPVVLVGLSVGFFFFPVFLLVEMLYLMDNSLNYSLNQTSREMLFVPVARDAKYRALAFIDMFVLRAAKALAGFLLLLLSWAASLMGAAGFFGESSTSIRWYMWMTIPLGLAWIAVAVYLGRRFTRERRESAIAEESHAPTTP